MHESFLQDIRFAARSLLRVPRFTVPAVLALALGIGTTSAIFSVLYGVMLKPLPYDDPDRIVSIWEANVPRNRPRNVVAPANFIAWQERSRSFEFLGMVGPSRLNVMLGGQPYEIEGMTVSSGVFPALGVRPALGRPFEPAEDLRGNDDVIVLSHEFWQTRLGGRADVIGSTLQTSGRSRRIVGVMPPHFTIEGRKADFYAPYGWTVEALRAAPGRGTSHAIARLREGVTVEGAAGEMRAIAAQLEQEAPRRNAGWTVAVVPIQELTIESIRPALLVMSGAVLLVLLIACVNVANLLLARGTVRQRELGVRTALGAGRARLVRQLLTESLLLAMVGGAAGLLVAVLFHRGLLTLVADRMPVPRLDQVGLDLPVLGLTLGLAVASGLLFGLAPALLASGGRVTSLRDGGRGGAIPSSRRVLSALVVAEVALSLVLLTGAGLLMRSFERLQNVNPGFRADGLLTARVTLPATRYPEESDAAAFFNDAVHRLGNVPGVQSAAGITFLPLSGPGMATSYYRADRVRPADGEQPVTDVRPVTPNYFRTMGIPQLAGRDFDERDHAGAPLVAIVSESLARQTFAGEDPLGKRLEVAIGRPGRGAVEIVGVVGDVKFASLDAETRAAIYMPHPQLSVGAMTFVLRTQMDPLALTRSVSSVVSGLDSELPVADVRPMTAVVDATLARARVVSVLLTAFALIAVVLAAVGVYGVMAYSVSQGTREIGVRMALGATRDSVFRLVIGRALRLVAAGVGAGLIVAALAAGLLETLLFGIEPLDPVTFAATALVLLVVAALASYVPARRGMRIQPVEALRAD